MDASILLSILAITFSILSLAIAVIQFGFRLTLEFAERPDIRDLKSKIEEELRNRLQIEINTLLDRFRDTSNIDEDDVREFVLYGRRAYVSQLPTMILQKITDKTSELISNFIGIFIGVILIVTGFWLSQTEQYLLPQDWYNAGTVIIFGFGFLLLYSILTGFKGLLQGLIALRKSFYSLSEDTSLDNAEAIERTLKEKELL